MEILRPFDLVCSVCIVIASKVEDITPASSKQFVRDLNKLDMPTRHKNFLNAEREVCGRLKFALNFRTPLRYVDRFLRASRASSHPNLSCSHSAMANGARETTNDLLERLVHYLLDLCLLDYDLFARTRPSLLTASAVYLARASLGISEPSSFLGSETRVSRKHVADEAIRCKGGQSFWSKTLEYYTSYRAQDLEVTVKLLRTMQEGAESMAFNSVYKKHRGVAERLVMCESDLGFA